MVVSSSAGHDKNGYFVIVELTGDFALICDGKRRPLEKPKRKRLKHLIFTNNTVDTSELTNKN